MKISSYVFFKSFIVLAVIFRLMIHVELIFFKWCEARVQLQPFVCVYPVITEPSTEHTMLSSFNCHGTHQKSIDYKFKGIIYILVSIRRSKILFEMHFSNKIKKPDFLS